ncbi:MULTISPECIES: Ms4533A family Cys-rich leader peptide [unclassified Streptomyces]|nr:Ms4533A family Cys-rich leader peptide [Streptomyces sp. HmicA12]
MSRSPVIAEQAAIELALIGVTRHCVSDDHCC